MRQTTPRRSASRRASIFTRRRAALVVLAALLLIPLTVVARRALRPVPDPLPAARMLLSGGDAAAAEAHVREALELRPRDAVAWHLLGECLRLRGHSQQAYDAFRRARSLAPTWDAPAVAMITGELAAGRDVAACRLLDTAFARGVRTAPVLRLRAHVLAGAADFAGAARALEVAARRPGGKARDRLDAVSHHRAAAFVSGAHEADIAGLLEDAERQLGPEDAGTRWALDAARGVPSAPPSPDDERALRHVLALDAARRIDDAIAYAAELRSAVDPEAIRHASRALPPQDAVRLAVLFAATPGARPERLDELESSAHLAAAAARSRAGHEQVAIAHLRELALLRPADPDVIFALGMRLGRAGRPETALSIAERLPGGGTAAAARQLLGWYHVGANEPRRAEPLLGTTRTRRGSVDAALVAARAAGPRATAERALDEASRAPGDALPRLLLGLVAMHAHNDADACAHLSAALARDPTLAVAANDLAWNLATRGGRADLAVPLASWALHLAPSDARIRHTHSEVLALRRRLPSSNERTSR